MDGSDPLESMGVIGGDGGQVPESDDDAGWELVAEGTIQFDAYLYDETQAVAAGYGARCTPDPSLLRNEGDGTFTLAYHGRLDDAMNPDDEPTEREMQAHVETVLAGEEVTQNLLRPGSGPLTARRERTRRRWCPLLPAVGTGPSSARARRPVP